MIDTTLGRSSRAVLFAALGFAAVAAAADAAVYRCGSAYSDQSCPDGERVALQDTTPAAVDAARARAAAERDERHADRMQRARLFAQAHERPPQAGSLGPATRPAAAAPTHPKKKKAKGRIRVVDRDDFIATPPRPAKTPAAPR